MKVVIQQPLFLPWYGFIDLVKKSDIFVFYDDVQLPTKSSFINRVQIKTPNGVSWFSPSIDRRYPRHNNINNSYYLDNNWRENHLKTLERFYKKSKFFKEMMDLSTDIYNNLDNNIASFNQYCCIKLLKYFNYEGDILKSSQLGIKGKKTARLVDICKELKCNHYITAHGAKNYLDYEMFENNFIKVSYIDYKCKEWTQFYGDFTPFVTVLDLIAHEGKNSINYLQSGIVGWREFVGRV